MIDLEVMEAKKYKPEILVLLESELIIGKHAFTVAEMTKYLLGMESKDTLSFAEKKKMFPIIEYSLDLLKDEGTVIYSGRSSSGESVYAYTNIEYWNSYKEDLIKFGILEKPEEMPTVETSEEGTKTEKIEQTSDSCT